MSDTSFPYINRQDKPPLFYLASETLDLTASNKLHTLTLPEVHNGERASGPSVHKVRGISS